MKCFPKGRWCILMVIIRHVLSHFCSVKIISKKKTHFKTPKHDPVNSCSPMPSLCKPRFSEGRRENKTGKAKIRRTRRWHRGLGAVFSHHYLSELTQQDWRGKKTGKPRVTSVTIIQCLKQLFAKLHFPLNRSFRKRPENTK